MDKTETSSGLRNEKLADSFQLSVDDNKFVVFRDYISIKSYIHKSRQITEHGLRFELEPYQSHVFMDIEEISDTREKKYERIENYLKGKGCLRLDDVWIDISKKSLHDAFKGFFKITILNEFQALAEKFTDNKIDDYTDDSFAGKLVEPSEILCKKLSEYNPKLTSEKLCFEILNLTKNILSTQLPFRYPTKERLLILWHGIILKTIKTLLNQSEMTDWCLWRLLQNALIESGIDGNVARSLSIVTTGFITEKLPANPILDIMTLFINEDTRYWANLHLYKGLRFLNKEVYEEMLYWAKIWGWLSMSEEIKFQELAEKSGYEYDEILDAISKGK